MARLRRVTAHFLDLPHLACQNLIERNRGVIRIFISMPTEAAVDGPELHVRRALCSTSRLRSTYVIHFDVQFGSWTGACFSGPYAEGRDRGRIALCALKERL